MTVLGRSRYTPSKSLHLETSSHRLRSGCLNPSNSSTSRRVIYHLLQPVSILQGDMSPSVWACTPRTILPRAIEYSKVVVHTSYSSLFISVSIQDLFKSLLASVQRYDDSHGPRLTNSHPSRSFSHTTGQDVSTKYLRENETDSCGSTALRGTLTM